MGYIPILFNTEMVQAIKDGRKTQTRRIAKQLCGLDPRVDGLLPENFKFWVSPLTSVVYWEDLERQVTVDGKLVLTPCWRNDILWVRETWCENKNPNSQNFGGYEYRADYEGSLCQDLITWRPSIHMPKEAARIFLRVKDVRVERLKAMSASDAMDEGVTDWNEFVILWDSTIKTADRERYGWDANPWVWVIEFERCEKPEW